MSSDLQEIQYAGQLIERARGEETPVGNPLAAARYYTTAIEIMISITSRHAATIEDLGTRLAFLSQVRNRVEVYAERAEVLLQVAAETGLLDKPGSGDGLKEAQLWTGSQDAPPALFGFRGGTPLHSVAEGRAAASPPVLGIPLPPPPQEVPMPPPGGNAGSGPSANYYIRPDAGMAAPPPPPEVNLDELMKSLWEPKDR